MVKYLLFLFAVLLGANVSAQTINIPDANFKSLLLSGNVTSDVAGNTIPLDTNNDGEVQLAEAQLVYGIHLWANAQYPVWDLTGIASFSNLEHLMITEHQVTTLDMSANTHLKILESIDNPVTSINVSNNLLLDRLECPYNQLTQIDISNNTILRELDMQYNQLAALNISNNPNLERVLLSNNQLMELDVTNNVHLGILTFENNMLSEIDLTQNTELDVLYCQNNELTTIDLSQNPEMDFFDCSNNSLLESFSIKNGSSLTIFGFANTPNLGYICADDFELSDVQNRVNAYGYLDVVVDDACNTLDMEDLSANQPLVFPNPARAQVTIVGTPEGTALSVTDMAGKTVYEGIATSGQTVVNTSGLRNGVYVISISDQWKKVSVKLVVAGN